MCCNLVKILFHWAIADISFTVSYLDVMDWALVDHHDESEFLGEIIWISLVSFKLRQTWGCLTMLKVDFEDQSFLLNLVGENQVFKLYLSD